MATPEVVASGTASDEHFVNMWEHLRFNVVHRYFSGLGHSFVSFAVNWLIRDYPGGTWRNNVVILSSKRRHYVVLTL